MECSQTKVVEFPEENEASGEFWVTWFGPDANDIEAIIALDVLGQYLCDSPLSILSQAFTKNKCSMAKAIRYRIWHQLPCVLRIAFESVPVEHLKTIESKLFGVLENIAAGGIDMGRMWTVLDRAVNRRLLSLERWPFPEMSKILTKEALYGSLDGKTLKKEARDLINYRNLSTWDSDQWIVLLKKWWLENPHVSIIGKPSAQLAKGLAEKERERVKTRKEKLGDHGLAELSQALDQAQNENNELAPRGLIDTFDISQIHKFSLIHVAHAVAGLPGVSSKNHGAVENHLNADPGNNGLNVVFSRIPSQFITVSLYIMTDGLPKQLLPYIALYLDLFFALPIERNGKLVDYREVLNEIMQTTDEYTATVGVQDIMEVLCITLRAKRVQYGKVVKLFSELLLHSVFHPERLSIQINNALNGAPKAKRQGDNMAREMMEIIHDESPSTKRAFTTLRQEPLLNELENRLNDDKDSVVGVFHELRRERRGSLYAPPTTSYEERKTKSACHRKRARLGQASLNMGRFRPRQKDWLMKGPSLLPIPLERGTLSLPLNRAGNVYIIPRGTQDSTYLIATTHSILLSEHHIDAPAISLTLAWLNSMEGILWRRIRGGGLGYGATIAADLRRGHFTFEVCCSPNAFAAWNEVRSVIGEISAGHIGIDEDQLDEQKSALAFDMVNSMGTYFQAARLEYVLKYLKGLPDDYSKNTLEEIKSVTREACHRIVNTYLTRLFKVETSNIVCVSGTTMVEEIVESFSQHKFNSVVADLEDFQRPKQSV